MDLDTYTISWNMGMASGYVMKKFVAVHFFFLKKFLHLLNGWESSHIKKSKVRTFFFFWWFAVLIFRLFFRIFKVKKEEHGAYFLISYGLRQIFEVWGRHFLIKEFLQEGFWKLEMVVWSLFRGSKLISVRFKSGSLLLQLMRIWSWR